MQSGCCFPEILFANICYIKVINRQRKFFTQYNALRAIELADALVGAQMALQCQHGVLKSGTYAFVIAKNQLYVVQGILYWNFSQSTIFDNLYFK